MHKVNPIRFLTEIERNDKNAKYMKWLTLKLIKQQSRIENDYEDDLLTLYGEAAEETVLDDIDLTFDEIMEQYGIFPKKLVLASLMLTDASYKYRTFATPAHLQNQGTYDHLIKPYMTLALNKKCQQ